MAKFSAIVLAVAALSASNALALPRHYALREVDIHAGPNAHTSSVTVTSTAQAHPTGAPHHNGSHPQWHHNGTHHNGTHNGTHHAPHHNGTQHRPNHGKPNHGKPKSRIGAVSSTHAPSSTGSSAASVPTGQMQVDGNTFAANSHLKESDNNETDTAHHNESNSSLNLDNSNGKGNAQVGSGPTGTTLPSGAKMSSTNSNENDDASHSESSHSLEVN